MNLFWSVLNHVYLWCIGQFYSWKNEHNRPSALVEDIDATLVTLKDTSLPARPIGFLQFVDEILSRVIQEVEKVDGVCKAEWTDTAGYLDSIRIQLSEFYQHLESTKHTELPDPSPFALELFINLRLLAVTLHECRAVSNTFHRFFMGPYLSMQINKCLKEARTLSQMLKSRMTPSLIFDQSLDELFQLDPHPVLDISKTATPRRYRLVECTPFTERGILRIWEFVYFPSVPYSAVSYVWRGNDVPEDFNSRIFSVRGAEDADPIGVNVLHDVCVASLKRGAPYLWLDRLCLAQTSKDDKNWNIAKMYDEYRLSSLCLVVPGGLQRLVSLQEETNWIHRGWTLQESLAPPVVEVLFLWNQGGTRATVAGDGNYSAWAGDITEIGSGRSAMAPLWLILDACMDGALALRTPDDFVQTRVSEIRLFGVGSKGYTGTTDFRFALPNVAALAAAVSKSMQEDHDRKCYTIWKCALMRTSSRPVDMVFSIMGLFDVSLDTSKFEVHDRVGATIALMREILGKGGRASWMGLAFHAPPSPRLSMFPNFPRTAVAGKALIRIPGRGGGRGKYMEISQLMDNEYPIAEVLGPMPHGSMDEEGYFSFEAKGVQIARVPQGQPSASNVAQQTRRALVSWDAEPSHSSGHVTSKQIPATNGTLWDVLEVNLRSVGVPSVNSPANERQPQAYAVLLGCFFGYSPMFTPAYDCNNVRGLIIEEHRPGKFGVVSYFTLSIKTIDWVVGWSVRTFCIGGPERVAGAEPEEDELRDGGEAEAVDMDADEQERLPLLQPPDVKTTFASIQSEHILAIARAAHDAERSNRKT